MTPRQIHRKAVFALRASRKLLDAAIEADACYNTYWKGPAYHQLRYHTVVLRKNAELSSIMASELMFVSAEKLNKDVSK